MGTNDRLKTTSLPTLLTYIDNLFKENDLHINEFSYFISDEFDDVDEIKEMQGEDLDIAAFFYPCTNIFGDKLKYTFTFIEVILSCAIVNKKYQTYYELKIEEDYTEHKGHSIYDSDTIISVDKLEGALLKLKEQFIETLIKRYNCRPANHLTSV
jgi:hypothetical protein